MLTAALDNVKPVVEVKSRRVGALPTRCPWKSVRSAVQTLAMRWLTKPRAAQRESMASPRA